MGDLSSDEDLSDDEDISDVSEAEFSTKATGKRRRKRKDDSDEEEMSYEAQPRKRHASWEPENDKDKGIERLPIKLADGRIQKSGGDNVVLDDGEESDPENEEEREDGQAAAEAAQRYRVEDVATGARFGRPAVVDVIGLKSRKARIQGAKEQIAGLCQEILGDPENSVRPPSLIVLARWRLMWRAPSTARPLAASAHLFLARGFHTHASGARSERPCHTEADNAVTACGVQRCRPWLPDTCVDRLGES